MSDLRPVICGIGELTERDADPATVEPSAFAARAVEAALEDAGPAAALRDRIGLVAVAPAAAVPDPDPGASVAARLELGAVRTMRSSHQGGNGPQLLVNAAAQLIQEGELEVAVVCGAEALASASRALRSGATMPQPPASPDSSDDVLDGERDPANADELRIGMIAPIIAYPLIENAIRAAAGRTRAEHLARISGLWSRFSEVAATRENAWSRQPYSAEQLATPTPDNRRVSDPYNKLHNANIQVDQAAALVLCSSELAGRLGIDLENTVGVASGARADDEWFVSERAVLDRSPAIAACAEAVLGHASVAATELGPIDLYSCFPAAVEIAATELGLPLDDHERPLTETGGLTFFGGPGNNYSTHGIAAVGRALRASAPGTYGLASALGWYATKHAYGLYCAGPAERPFAAYSATMDLPPPRELASIEQASEAAIETYTVIYERDGTPGSALAFGELADGRRVLTRSDDAATLAGMEARDPLGSGIVIDPAGNFTLDDG